MKNTQTLLNDIYQCVDLKEDLFPYLTPYISKAMQMLKNAQRQTSINSPESIRRLENILSFDLPDLVDNYASMPLEYRNSKKIKSNKTHRDFFIESIEVICNTIQEIEHEQFESQDKTQLVQNRALREKYATDTQSTEKFVNSFSWENFSQHLNFSKKQVFIENDTPSHLESVFITQQNTIGIKKPFKERFISTFKKITQKIKYGLKEVGFFIGKIFEFLFNTDNFIVCVSSMVISVFSLIAIVLIIISSGIHMLHNHYHKYSENINAFSNLTEDYQHNPTPDMKFNMLSAMKSYQIAHPEMSFQFDEKQNAILIEEHFDHGRCLDTLTDNEKHYTNFIFELNGHEYNSRNALAPEMKEVICKINNTLDTTMSLNTP